MRRTLIESDSYITPDGIEYPLTAPNSRVVFSWEGEGMPPIDYITQRGPFQHGETVLNFFLRPRILQAIIRHSYCSRSAYWDGRADLLDVLRPNRQTPGNITPGRLRKRLANGDIRDLDVFILEGPGFAARPGSSWDEWSYSETIRFIAYNPVWFHPTEQTQTLTIISSETITFRAAESANTNDSTSRSITIAKPTGTVVGDFLLAAITIATTSSSVNEFLTVPSDWTFLRATGNDIDGILYLYYKIATDSEPTNYTWADPQGGTSARGMAGIIATFDGAQQVSPFNVENAQTTSGATFTAPNVTTTVANCMGILVASAEEDTSTWSNQLIDAAAATEPANGDKQNNAGGTADDCTISLAYKSIGAAQAVNTNTADKAGTASGVAWIGCIAPESLIAANLTYTGTWLEYPTLTLNGPLINPTIRNLTTEEKITLNITLIAGESIEIDLRYGVKTVTKNDGTNQIGTLSDDSDLATFHLAPDPEAAGGINSMLLNGTAGDTGSLVIEWYPRYIGL